MRLKAFAAIVCFLVLLLIPSLLSAQAVNFAQIHGRVSDTSGAFTGAPILLTLHATQDLEHTLPPNVMFTNISAASSVPEPSTWAMMALGLGALGYAASRRRKTNVSTLAA